MYPQERIMNFSEMFMKDAELFLQGVGKIVGYDLKKIATDNGLLRKPVDERKIKHKICNLLYLPLTKCDLL